MKNINILVISVYIQSHKNERSEWSEGKYYFDD